MHFFNIKDIENLTGIKAHTLRVWEQRYSMHLPKRKESKHRLYDNEDLKQLLRISYLYHQGWKVSKIAQLSAEKVLEEVDRVSAEGNDYTYFTNQLIEYAVDFDKEGFLKKLDEIIAASGFENTIVKVCYPLLQRIGMLWMTSHIIPAQEHFCSYIIQHKIIAETESLPNISSTTRQILVFCPHGEYHDLPLFYINYLLRKNGWSNIFLGANVSLPLLKQFAEAGNAEYMFLHVITNFTGLQMEDYLEVLCREFEGKKIVASGSGVQHLQRNFKNLKILKSDKEVYRFIEKEELPT